MLKLPFTLLTRLAAPAGAKLAPEVAAAKLIAGLESQQPDAFYWPSQNGIVFECLQAHHATVLGSVTSTCLGERPVP